MKYLILIVLFLAAFARADEVEFIEADLEPCIRFFFETSGLIYYSPTCSDSDQKLLGICNPECDCQVINDSKEAMKIFFDVQCRLSGGEK